MLGFSSLPCMDFSKFNEQISQHSRCEFVRDLCAGSLPIFPWDANAWIYIYGSAAVFMTGSGATYTLHTTHCWGNEGWEKCEEKKSARMCKSTFIFAPCVGRISMGSLFVGLSKTEKKKIKLLSVCVVFHISWCICVCSGICAFGAGFSAGRAANYTEQWLLLVLPPGHQLG